MFDQISPQTKSAIGYFSVGFLAVAVGKYYWPKPKTNNGALAMKYNGLALQSNPGGYGAIHLNNPGRYGAIHLNNPDYGAIHLSNPGYMGAINLGAIHLNNPGGVVRKGVANRRQLAYHG